MKRLTSLCLSIVFVLTLVSTGFSLTLVGLTANPFVDPSYTANSTSGFVDYTAFLITTNPAVPNPAPFNFLQLQFFDPIFSSFSFTGIVSAPGSWSGSFIGPLLQLSGTPAGAGTSVTFRVNYTLKQGAFDPTLINGLSPWSSFSPWSQNFLAIGTDGSFAAGSGQLVPEPTTLLLLGSGLFGFGLAGRILKKYKKTA